MRKLSLVILFSILSCLGWAQKNEKLKESFLDSASYVYFMNAKHNELVKLTNTALSAGIDSYYLRVRVGVSYFTKNEFYQAAVHLQKALAFYPSDMYTKEYLFYAYLYQENYEEAKILIAKMPISYQEYYKKMIKNERSLVVETGYQTTKYVNPQDSAIFLAKDPSDTSLHGNGIYAESDRMKSIQYVQLGVGYPISKRIKGYSGVSLVRNNREQNFYTRSKSDTTNLYTLSQYQLYSGLSIALPNHFNLQVGGQFMYYAQNKLYANYNATTFTYSFKDSLTNRGNGVSNISLSKSYGKLIPTISLGYSKIDAISIMQYAAQLVYLPLGNFKLNVTAGIANSSDKNGSRLIYYTKIGGRISDNLWYDAYIYAGNLKNFNEGNAYVVYNISDKITMKSGVNLSYYLTAKCNVGLRYDLLKRESTYDRYYLAKNQTYRTYSDNYLNHSLIFNVVWKF
jgi:hypothetical protein